MGYLVFWCLASSATRTFSRNASNRSAAHRTHHFPGRALQPLGLTATCATGVSAQSHDPDYGKIRAGLHRNAKGPRFRKQNAFGNGDWPTNARRCGPGDRFGPSHSHLIPVPPELQDSSGALQTILPTLHLTCSHHSTPSAFRPLSLPGSFSPSALFFHPFPLQPHHHHPCASPSCHCAPRHCRRSS